MLTIFNLMQYLGLGGGLFMSIYDPENDEMFAINARETAPANVDPQLYESDPQASLTGK